MTNDHETNMALSKVLIAWVGTMLGGITLSDMVLAATLLYTLMQIVVTARKLIKGEA